MAAATFVLRNPESENLVARKDQKKTSIQFIVRNKGRRLKIGTGLSIESFKWNQEGQRICRKAQ